MQKGGKEPCWAMMVLARELGDQVYLQTTEGGKRQQRHLGVPVAFLRLDISVFLLNIECVFFIFIVKVRRN